MAPRLCTKRPKMYNVRLQYLKGYLQVVVRDLKEPIVLTIPLTKKFNLTELEVQKQNVCKFFNETTKAWSSDGCRLLNYTATYVTCGCNHMTSFAADFISAFDDVIQDSNLKDFTNIGAFAYINWEVLIVTIN